ncbi:MAG: hypothetical protein WC522_05480 [Candidatus Omnitrophota bacterium]
MLAKTIEPIKKIVREHLIREFFRTVRCPRKNVIDNLLTDRPFDYSAEWRPKFLDAMRWSFNHHRSNSAFYKKLCQKKGFGERRIDSFEDIWDIPFVLSDVFKMYAIETRTDDMWKGEMSSSGTSGRKSKIWLDRISAQRLMFSLYQVHRALGLVSSTPANYLLMAYNPSLDETLGTTTSDIIMSHLTPRRGIFYGLDKDASGKVGFLRERAAEKLRQYVKEAYPVRMLGFIHHICEVIRSYRQKYGRVEFPKDSYIVSGGGWKNIVNPYGDDFDLYAFLRENTTLPTENMRDLYTLIEHDVFYLECAHHNKHIPNVALACSREPRTLKRLGYGEKGLIHLYSPLVESCPALSLLTTDYGYIGEDCACSIGGPYVKIIGRAGVAKKVTCAFTADQYVKDMEKI